MCVVGFGRGSKYLPEEMQRNWMNTSPSPASLEQGVQHRISQTVRIHHMKTSGSALLSGTSLQYDYIPQ